MDKKPEYWNAQARRSLEAALRLQPRAHRAKNLILFLGDGKVNLVLKMREEESLYYRHRFVANVQSQGSQNTAFTVRTGDFQWEEYQGLIYRT